MQVNLAVLAAPVLARFAVVVDGPLETAVVARIAASGDLRVPLGALTTSLTAAGATPAEAVTVVREVVARLVAGGAVEHVGGGYRLADPALATALRSAGVTEAVTTFRLPADKPAAPAPAHVPGPTARAAPGSGTGPDRAGLVERATIGAAGLRQRLVPVVAPGATAARSAGAAPATGVAELAAVLGPQARPVPAEGLPRVVAGLPAPAAVRTPSTPGGALTVLAGSPTPGAVHELASRAVLTRSVLLAHVPLPPPEALVTEALGRSTDLVGALALRSDAGGPVVVDRALALPLLVAASRGALPGRFVVDLRGAGVPVSAAVPGGIPGVEMATMRPSAPDAAAAAVAGAAAIPGASTRPRPARRRGRVDLASLLEVLFGPRLADLLPADGDGERGREDVDDDRDDVDGQALVVDGAAGLVIGGADAEAVAELLGVQVLVVASGDDVTEEVLAFLEDGDERTLLAPRV